ncbi:MAG: nucleotidyl transferase AbiEii/AbiGii toxin family protein [Bacteroidota bacterium]
MLNILKELNLPFYLTGGTPLSRYYFNHRYSDDLDLFVNDEDNFPKYCSLIYQKLIDSQDKYDIIIDKQRLKLSQDFMQIFVSKNNINLKIDFVNDVAPHYGDFELDSVLGKIDSLRNILSNKFSALYRFEPKDAADIWIICKSYDCDFKEIIAEAKNKEAGVDPISVYEILTSFPDDKIKLIKWVSEPDHLQFKNELAVIADDILNGRRNTIAG